MRPLSRTMPPCSPTCPIYMRVALWVSKLGRMISGADLEKWCYFLPNPYLGFFVCFFLNDWVEIYLGWGRELGESTLHQSGRRLRERLDPLFIWSSRALTPSPGSGREDSASLCSVWGFLRPCSLRGRGPRGGAGRLRYMGGPHTRDLGTWRTSSAARAVD